jgi:heme/copper-type cytochrome/quinol oxidase subunit 3
VSSIPTRPPVDAPHEPIVPAPSSWRLWVVLLGGPAAWFGHFMIVYLTAEAVCTPPLVGSEQPWSDTALDTFVLVTTVVVAAMCIALAVIATVALRREPEQWLWWVAIALAVGSCAAVLAVGLPSLLVGPC